MPRQASARASKNDAVDAEAIFYAAAHPTMLLVPVRPADQRDPQPHRRLRDRLVSQRMNLITHANAASGEIRPRLPQASVRFSARVRTEFSETELSLMPRAIFGALCGNSDILEIWVEQLEGQRQAI